MAQLNLDNFQLELGQVRMITKDSGQTVQSIEILLGNQTKEALHDYTKVLRYGDIDFSAKIKVTNSMSEIVDDDGPDGEEVKIGLIDKSFVVDENLNLELKLDSNKMSNRELTSSISNVEILSKAKAIIWIDKVKSEIQRLAGEAREQNEKDPKLFKFLTVKESVMKEVKTEVTDEDTQEDKEVITYEPTGKTQTVNYSSSDKQEFEDKYISLLDTYNRKQIIPISVEEYALDMIFNSDSNE